jgi:hypothetical protein
MAHKSVYCMVVCNNHSKSGLDVFHTQASFLVCNISLLFESPVTMYISKRHQIYPPTPSAGPEFREKTINDQLPSFFLPPWYVVTIPAMSMNWKYTVESNLAFFLLRFWQKFKKIPGPSYALWSNIAIHMHTNFKI